LWFGIALASICPLWRGSALVHWRLSVPALATLAVHTGSARRHSAVEVHPRHLLRHLMFVFITGPSALRLLLVLHIRFGMRRIRARSAAASTRPRATSTATRPIRITGWGTSPIARILILLAVALPIAIIVPIHGIAVLIIVVLLRRALRRSPRTWTRSRLSGVRTLWRAISGIVSHGCRQSPTALGTLWWCNLRWIDRERYGNKVVCEEGKR
jgi:hypothetical protein